MNDDIRSIGGPDAGPDDDANLNSRLMFRPRKWMAPTTLTPAVITGSQAMTIPAITRFQSMALDLPVDIEGTDAPREDSPARTEQSRN